MRGFSYIHLPQVIRHSIIFVMNSAVKGFVAAFSWKTSANKCMFLPKWKLRLGKDWWLGFRKASLSPRLDLYCVFQGITFIVVLFVKCSVAFH